MAGSSDHELAAELLDVVNTQELAEFVDRQLVGGPPPGRAGTVDPARRRLVDSLMATAVRTVPLLAPLAAHHVDPLVAQARAARFYDLELEGLSHEDRNYLIAQQFVRHARRAVAAHTNLIPTSTRKAHHV